MDALIVIGVIIAYLGIGLVSSRAVYRSAKKHGDHGLIDDEIMPVFMVPFWPVVGVVLCMYWAVTHDSKELGR